MAALEGLPDDVAAALTRGISAYLKATPQSELPPGLRRFRSFMPRALTPHRNEILSHLDDDAFRALVLEWIENGRTPLTSFDLKALQLAAGRPQGWEQTLAELSRRKPATAVGGSGSSPEAPVEPTGPAAKETAKAVAREREKSKKARAEARRAKEEARRIAGEARAHADQAQKEAAALKESVTALEQELQQERAALTAARAETDRLLRKQRRDLERAEQQAEAARASVKKERRRSENLRIELENARAEIERLRRALARRKNRGSDPGPRAPLPVPPGRLADDPETLDDWLRNPGVRLLVDGYNVTKSERGFSDLDLERQRERLVEEVTKLARRRGIDAAIVFDGAQVAPGTQRRRRGPVEVHYSRPPESGDDHLVALLDELPPDPVIVTTNDRELQRRTLEKGATIATSDMLLALIR
ncbi:MAG TPA: NYN domain-containing protein [Actinomycetota bacterium]|jgi:predicted RNA-binding protein with PIN domain|nr:NYN domain-containing protein [Actinomycetota bacterium]